MTLGFWVQKGLKGVGRVHCTKLNPFPSQYCFDLESSSGKQETGKTIKRSGLGCLQKYDLEQGCWFPRTPVSGKASQIWKDICSLRDVSSCIGTIIQEGFSLQIHSGMEVSFWNHVWLGDTTLREDYPRLYLISSQKEAVVSAMRVGTEEGRWNMIFSRELRDWENLQVEELKQKLQLVSLDSTRPDSMIWKHYAKF